MKTIFALATALCVGSAFAQNSDPKNMVQFDLDSTLQGALTYGKSKVPNQDSDNETALQLQANYYRVFDTVSKNLQLGGELTYVKDTNTTGDFENWGGEIGAFWNFSSGGSVDLTNALYAGATLGYGWNNNYGAASTGNDDDEFVSTSVVLGKRFSLERFGANFIYYTPELAWVSQDSKTTGDLDYSSELQARFLQFSVLW